MSVSPSDSPAVIETIDLNPEASAPPVEVKPDAEKPAEEKKPDDFLAPKFAALTRKEKEIRAKETAIKQREAELEQKLKDMEAKLAESQAFQTKLKESPLSTLRDQGLTFQQLAEMQLNEENPSVEVQLKRMKAELESKTLGEVEALKKMLADKEQAQAQKAYDDAVAAYKGQLDEYVSQNAEKYELILANDATDLLLTVAEQYFETHKKVPDMSEVADAVEAHFEEEAKKIFELKKFKKQTSNPKPNETKGTAPTLSNTDAATVPKSGGLKLNDEESKREAAKLIKWEE